MSESAAARLREERERLGISQRAFAELGKVSKNTQLAYESGASPITLDYLGRVADRIDIGYVATGARQNESLAERRTPYRGPPAQIRSKEQAELVEVAEIDLRFGLGAYWMDDHPVPQMRLFSRAWLRQFTSSPADMLYWARGQGNSMEPTISDGDILLIDRTEQTPSFADLYWAIAFGHVGMIKRLRPMPDGSVKILSDNPSVPPETAVDDELHVFGRVVAILKRV